jgi:hypothetical protein
MRTAAVAGSLAALPLVGACSAEDDDSAADDKLSKISAPEAAVVAPAKVEVIAGLTGCKVTIRVQAKELREGVCHTEKGDYLITTFPEERYKETWLETIRLYGGRYLVGSRWVVSAPQEMLEPFRTKLGGTVRQLSRLGPTAGS